MENILYFDNLTLVMMALVSFVGLTVATYSMSYLSGDRKKGPFYFNLLTLISTVFVMFCADHLLLFFTAWTMSNLFLTRLMLHKREWPAARESSWLALKNFTLGSFLLGGAFLTLYAATNHTSIQTIIRSDIDQRLLFVSTILILLSAMTQSALWPFHRWLTSSLNSPTPVSALMHAGLINGGGFLIARFAPLFLSHPYALQITFITGMVTALLGSLWMLMQHDVKRMLAASTMGQMGFMIAQCGLGLFPAAIAHLVLHGLFKAYLFLASGTFVGEKRLDLSYPPRISHLLLAMLCGACGAYTFIFTSNKNPLAGDTTLFLMALALIAGTQCALPIIRGNRHMRVLHAIITTSIMGIMYGLSVYLIETAIAPLQIAAPQPFNSLHLIALIMLVSTWLATMLYRPRIYPEWMLKMYVTMLNASQPHPKTVTTYRKQYHY